MSAFLVQTTFYSTTEKWNKMGIAGSNPKLIILFSFHSHSTQNGSVFIFKICSVFIWCREMSRSLSFAPSIQLVIYLSSYLFRQSHRNGHTIQISSQDGKSERVLPALARNNSMR